MKAMFEINLKVNLRWPLRLVCLIQHDHPRQVVMAGTAFDRGYTYCKRCGLDWRRQGLKKCWFPFQHRWGRHPSALGPAMEVRLRPDPILGMTETEVPIREIEQCNRCLKGRVRELHD